MKGLERHLRASGRRAFMEGNWGAGVSGESFLSKSLLQRGSDPRVVVVEGHSWVKALRSYGAA